MNESKESNKSFGRDVGKLLSGTVLSQIIAFITVPIITRIFNPDIYGEYTIFVSFLAVLNVICCLRYEQAILLPKNNSDSASIVLLSTIILLIICAVLTPVFLLFGDAIASIFNAPEISDYLILIPISLLIEGFYLIFRYWNTRKKRFMFQSGSQVLQTSSTCGIQLSAGLFGIINAGSLIIGRVIGFIFGASVLFICSVKYDLTELKSGLSLKNIKIQLIRYKKFPLIESGAFVINNISWQMPVFLFSAFFSPIVAGLYALGFQIIQLPLSLIGSSLEQVYMQRASKLRQECNEEGCLKDMVEDITEILFIMLCIPLAVLLVLGGDLFGLIFGSEWFEAGVFCQILAVWAIFWFISAPLAKTLTILEVQECHLRFTILNLVTRILSLSIGGLLQNVYIALWLFVISGIISYLYLFSVIYYHSKASVKTVLFNLKYNLAASLFIVLFLFILEMLGLNTLIVIILAGIIMIIYYVLLYNSNNKLKSYFQIR